MTEDQAKEIIELLNRIRKHLTFYSNVLIVVVAFTFLRLMGSLASSFN